MRFRFGALIALIGVIAGLGLWAHQGRTQDAGDGTVIPVLSTTDCVGYTSPCG